jgi:hypothetical protein
MKLIARFIPPAREQKHVSARCHGVTPLPPLPFHLRAPYQQDIICDGETGVLVENGNADLCAEELLKLVESKELHDRLSQNGRRFVNEKYHYTRLVANVDALYKRLLQEAKKR